jgi:signal transduction histidine kinase
MDRSVLQTAQASQDSPPRLRGRVALIFTTIVLVACLVSAALLVSRAANERRTIEHRAQHAAAALSFAFDQEVAAVNYLLTGLSKSPALLSGDTSVLYEQFKATPVPEGSHLVLNDLERQVINTFRPYGAPLPRHADFPNHQEQLDRIRDRRWTVSGRMMGLVKGGVVVALSLRLDGPDGRMNGFITTILSEARLDSVLAAQEEQTGWSKGLYDRKLQPISTARDRQAGSEVAAPAVLAEYLAGAGPDSTIEGTVEGIDDVGTPVLVAFRRSGATNWTTAVMVPMADLRAPIADALWQMTGPAALLILAGGLAALFTARQVERPLRTMSELVTGAQHQVHELSDQLLALQEDERQRIARELHDSTAQHLVAANLGLASLKLSLPEQTHVRKVFADTEAMLAEALRELRIFTYLLHPPNLARDGLQATLREFAEGFAGRTGLVARIRIPEEVDDIPPDLQRAVLRVVQEALTNVHRHADATWVVVTAAIKRGRLVVRIRDNGHGMTREDRSPGQVRLGVGIVGMRARLEQFGGRLKFKTRRTGTTVIADVPLSAVDRRPFRATAASARRTAEIRTRMLS